MATVYVDIPPVQCPAGTASTTVQLHFNPPANVSGKLCFLFLPSVVTDVPEGATASTFKLECDLPQPSSATMTPSKASSTNSVIFLYNSDSPPFSQDKPIVVQLPDGPVATTFKLSRTDGDYLFWEIQQIDEQNVKVPIQGTTPRINMLWYLTPVTKNPHFEKLESYSTGPWIRL